MFDLKAIRALTFDVGGTVFDWHSTIRDAIAEVSAQRDPSIDASTVANQWRRQMFQLLTKVRSGELPWLNADDLHRMAIDDVAKDYPSLALTAGDKDALTMAWHRMRVWPDFPPALEALRTRYTVTILTVLSWAIAVDSSKRGGLNWDGIMSCEFLGHYKPAPQAYRSAAKLLHLEPGQVMMVAAHPNDLRAAMATGMRSAYVPRAESHDLSVETEFPQPDIDVNAADFADLVRQIVP